MSEQTFYEAVVPQWMKANHRRCGGTSLRAYMSDLPHGHTLRIFVGREPWDVSNKQRLHVSIAVGMGSEPGPIRKPTQDEVEAVKNLFPDYTFEQDIDPDDKRLVHLWEVS